MAAQPRPQSRPHSTSSEGPYLPPGTHGATVDESDFDFCNSFWVTPQRSRRDARDQDSEERDWGKQGYDTVSNRVKASNKVLEDLKAIFKDRASIEEDYSKRLAKLSKSAFGTGETGHMERAMTTLKQELETSSKSHHDLASLLKQQENMVNDFIAKRDGARKTQQSVIEKTWKAMNNQREHVLKAKSKYENDAIQINSLHAQASLLQGRELDKATLKMDKVQQTVVVNERDYKNFVGVLKETTVNWNMAWKTFCDLVQDQEEERLEFIKGRMWDWANAQSTIAMAEDESAERTRTALEQCEPKLDIRIFVQTSATGNCIPDPLPFVDASRTTPHPKQGYKIAKFTRSSTRIPGVKHSPSAVNDIARALHQQQQQQPASNSIPPSSSFSNPSNSARSPASALAHQRGTSSTSLSGGGISRPASRGAQHPSNSNLLVDPTSASYATASSQETTPTRPPPQNNLDEPINQSSSRFAPSPNAALRHQPATGGETLRSESPTPGAAARPGHINASAFQNRPQQQQQPQAGIAPPSLHSQLPSSASSSPRKQSGVPGAQARAEEDAEDDPLLQALKVLQSTPAPVSSPRSSRMSPNPTATSHASSHAAAGAPGRPLSSMGTRSTTPQHQRPQSVSLGAGGGAAGNRSAQTNSRSRPTSPAPIAAMMAPPAAGTGSAYGTSPQRHSMSVPYGQAFPGERAAQSLSRPASRAGSNVSSSQPAQAPSSSYPGSGPGMAPNRNSLASPSSVPNFHGQQPARATSPAPGGVGFAGVGARGRSPSPQPFIPESLRPRSPAIAQRVQTQSQQQPRPTSAYGNHPHVQPQQQLQPQSPYGNAAAVGHNRPSSNYGGYPQQGAQQHYPTAPQQQHPAASPGPYARTASPAMAAGGGYVPSRPSGHPYASSPASSSVAPAQTANVPQSYAPPQQVQHAHPYAQQQPHAQQQQIPHSYSNMGPASSLAQQQQHASPLASVPPSPGNPYPYGGNPSHVHPHQTSSPYAGTAGMAPMSSTASQGAEIHRAPSVHSGVGSVVSAAAAPAQSPYHHGQQQQPGHVRATSVASVRAGSVPPPPPPPTGQYTDQGQPIIFYVNALFDYRAASNEEFSFAQGDVIAVTATDPDGWWQGLRVGDQGPSRLFPSNFTELLS